ncbi:MAG: GNAT family N-acetyltransferase, partial [Cyanobacteria bacterium J06626_18]
MLQKAGAEHLSRLLHREVLEVDGFLRPDREKVAPDFLLSFAIERLSQDPQNSFWWAPRLVIVDRLIVGMCGFKGVPSHDGSVEVGYGIIPSQQRQGFATQAVRLLVEDGFSRSKIQTITACTDPSNIASCKVLEKNQFICVDRKSDPEDGE